jgi:hypothetical protein
MFNHLLKGLVTAVFFWLVNRYRRVSIEVLKLEAAGCYLKGIQAGRRGLFSILKIWLAVFFFALGVVLLHAALFCGLYLWTQSIAAVALGLLVVGGLYVGFILLAAGILLSEKAWMQYFKADKLVADLTRDK